MSDYIFQGLTPFLVAAFEAREIDPQTAAFSKTDPHLGRIQMALGNASTAKQEHRADILATAIMWRESLAAILQGIDAAIAEVTAASGVTTAVEADAFQRTVISTEPPPDPPVREGKGKHEEHVEKESRGFGSGHGHGRGRSLSRLPVKMMRRGNAASVSTTAKYAASFNAASSQYLMTPDVAILRTSGVSFTMSGWYNPTSLAVAAQGVVGKATVDFENLTVLQATTLSFFSGTDAAGKLGSTAGAWNSFVGWQDIAGNTVNLSLNNGVTVTVTRTMTPGNGGNFLVGSYFLDNFFTGAIASVGLWSRVLTALERTTLYNAGKGKIYAGLDAGLKTSLVAWWDLSEVSGNRVDSVGGLILADHGGVGQTTGPGA